MDSCAYGEDGKPIKLCPVCSETAVGEPSLCYKVDPPPTLVQLHHVDLSTDRQSRLESASPHDLW